MEGVVGCCGRLGWRREVGMGFVGCYFGGREGV